MFVTKPTREQARARVHRRRGSLTLTEVTMPDEQDRGRPGDKEVPDVVVVSSDGEGQVPGGEILELDEFRKTAHGSKRSTNMDILKGSDRSGRSESEVSIEVGVVKTAQAPGPLAVAVAQQPSDPDRLQTQNADSDYSSTKSSPGYTSTTDLCGDELSELDGSSLEKANAVSPAALGDFSPKLIQTRDSFDMGCDGTDGDEDGRSVVSRQSVKEGVCGCYQAIHRAFLRCVEETPAMLSGLVLSLAFCVAIIVLIPSTGRVSGSSSNTLIIKRCSKSSVVSASQTEANVLYRYVKVMFPVDC